MRGGTRRPRSFTTIACGVRLTNVIAWYSRKASATRFSTTSHGLPDQSRNFWYSGGRAGHSSLPPGHQERLDRRRRRGQLVPLDRAGRVDPLRAGPRALADERAAPDTLGLGQHGQPQVRALVARIQVVPLGERDRRRPDELAVQPVHRAGRVAEHAVDAHPVLLVLLQLRRGLQVLALLDRLLLVADQPGLHRAELGQEVGQLHDQVPDDREVRQRLDPYRSRRVVGQERAAGELRLTVDVRAAAAADPHPARPAVRQGAVQLVLDVVQAVEYRPVVAQRYLVLVEARPVLLLRPVPGHLQGDLVRHLLTSRRPV